MQGLELREDLYVVGRLAHEAHKVEASLSGVIIVFHIKILQMYVMTFKYKLIVAYVVQDISRAYTYDARLGAAAEPVLYAFDSGCGWKVK